MGAFMGGKISEDVRMDRLEKSIDGMRLDITDIKTKIYNGFENSITTTKDKVHEIEKKLDRMLWFIVISSVGFAGGIITAIIKGWI